MGDKGTKRQTSAPNEADFRKVLSHFATGITIVTGHDRAGRQRAITVNAFTSVSLDPLLVLYCLGKQAFSFDVFAEAEAFAVNLVSMDQQALSDRFAAESADAFPDLSVSELATGSPVLAGSLAALDCETEAIHEAGDHLIVVGRVVALQLPSDGEPLIYFGSRYRELMP